MPDRRAMIRECAAREYNYWKRRLVRIQRGFLSVPVVVHVHDDKLTPQRVPGSPAVVILRGGKSL